MDPGPRLPRTFDLIGCGARSSSGGPHWLCSVALLR